MTLPIHRFAAGSAYIDGRYMPLSEAAIPMTHWGYRRSDVTYDVVGVWEGSFFRLDDHLRRFRASMLHLHMRPDETEEVLRAVLQRLVRISGLRSAYVAMDCLRSVPAPGMPYQAAHARSYIAAFAKPWASLASEEHFRRGLHLVVAATPRIPSESVDPRVKNFHWGDLSAGQQEAFERGADFAVLLDAEGNVTEGPGFNVFSITGGVVATPIRGALEGITRLSVLELCAELGIPCEVRAVSAAEFRDADEIFCCSTAGGIMPASRIDGRIMGNDRPGPISTTLKERFWSKRAEGWHATPVDYAAVDEGYPGV